MEVSIKRKYNEWRKNAVADKDLIEELEEMYADESKIEDAFYKDLTFGTGGLRGIIGAGTNRMNIYTVGKATQGYCDYLRDKYDGLISVAISYDSRIKSSLFASVAAEIFAANGIKVYIYSELMPTPCLSFAVRQLGCKGGVMITASHNPAKYNGYKVYGSDGCQITDIAAGKIQAQIQKVNMFSDIKSVSFEKALKSGLAEYISESVIRDYINAVLSESVSLPNELDKNIKIVYTPLNGSGRKPVIRALEESGFTNIIEVLEQAEPDGNFPTCPYPNPENSEAMHLALENAKKFKADLVLATDPDCDRVGIAIRYNGDYVLLSGNEVGILLFDYICSSRIRNGKMPANPIAVKTIVTTSLAEKVADTYGVELINVLTGFKYIGEQIGLLEKKGEYQRYIFGFEESYGYLSGTYVRDKDGVNASVLIAEMVAFYRRQNLTLVDKLRLLYKQYGYSINSLFTYDFEGVQGKNRIESIMSFLRQGKKQLPDDVWVIDYASGQKGLPKSNVIEYKSKNFSFIVRPSGTEPKLKIYIGVTADNVEAAEEFTNKLKFKFENSIGI